MFAQWRRFLPSSHSRTACVTLRPTGYTQTFFAALARSVSRQIEQVAVIVLHGVMSIVSTIDQAIELIERYDAGRLPLPVERFEIEVHYSNGDRIRGLFKDQTGAIEFLRSYQPTPTLTPG